MAKYVFTYMDKVMQERAHEISAYEGTSGAVTIICRSGGGEACARYNVGGGGVG